MEEINLPAGVGPHLLAESMKELREKVKWYLSFSDEEVFQGVPLPKKEEDQSPETLPADVPKTPCAPELATERRSPKFLGWEKFCIPLDQWWLLGKSPHHARPQGQEEDQPAPPGWTSKASSPSIEDSHPIQTLLASMGIGSHVDIDSTAWLCRGDSLSLDARAFGNGL